MKAYKKTKPVESLEDLDYFIEVEVYTEEQVIEFAKWLASNWFALWVKDKFLWECDWSENAENQDYKGYYTEKQLLELFKSLKQK